MSCRPIPFGVPHVFSASPSAKTALPTAQVKKPDWKALKEFMTKTARRPTERAVKSAWDVHLGKGAGHGGMSIRAKTSTKFTRQVFC